MTLPELLPVLAIHLYAIGTVAAIAGVLSRRDWLKRAALILGVVAFGCHTLLLGTLFAAQGITGLTRSSYIAILAWCVTLGGLLAWLRWRYDALLLISAPLALLAFLVALLFRHADAALPPVLSGMTFSIHILAMFSSIGLMALSFGAGALFLYQNRNIKSKARLEGFRQDMPALSALDRINKITVMAGFPLFSIGLLFGFVSARLNWGTLLTGDPKELVSLLVWGVYAWLFHMRFAEGRQGRKPAQLAILVFVFCAFSLIVVNLLLPTHHSFLTTPR